MTREQLNVIRYAYLDLKAFVDNRDNPFGIAEVFESAADTVAGLEAHFATELDDLIKELEDA